MDSVVSTELELKSGVVADVDEGVTVLLGVMIEEDVLEPPSVTVKVSVTVTVKIELTDSVTICVTVTRVVVDVELD